MLFLVAGALDLAVQQVLDALDLVFLRRHRRVAGEQLFLRLLADVVGENIALAVLFFLVQRQAVHHQFLAEDGVLPGAALGVIHGDQGEGADDAKDIQERQQLSE